MSFRASEARHGIQYFDYILDTGFRRYDGLDGDINNYDKASQAGIEVNPDSIKSLVSPPQLK
jgi:hypothetical protein